MIFNDKEKDIKDFLRRHKEIQSAQLITQSGFISMVASPAASRELEKRDKLAVCLTFEEWRAIELVLELADAKNFLTIDSSTLGFLRECIASIPAPDATVHKPLVPEDYQPELEQVEENIPVNGRHGIIKPCQFCGTKYSGITCPACQGY